MDILDTLLARADHTAAAIRSAVKRLADLPDGDTAARKRQTLVDEIGPLAAELVALTALTQVLR